MNAMSRGFFVAMCVLAVVVSRAVAGSTASAADVPRELVSWRFDPAGFSSVERAAGARSLIESGVRTLLATGVVEDEDAAAAIGAVLGLSVVAAGPHELRVFAGDGAGDSSSGGPDEISAVLMMDRPGDTAAVVRTLRAVLVDSLPDDGAAVQSEIEWADGTKAVRLRREAWPEWLAVAWGVRAGRLVVEVGSPPAVEVGNAGGPFALRIDLDGLRRSLPRQVARGDVNDAFGIAGLAHARWWSVDGGFEGVGEDRVLRVRMAWSSRREAPDVERGRELRDGACPSWALGLGGSYVLPMDVDWRGVVERVLAATAADVQGWKRMELDARRQMWARQHGATLERLLGSLGEVAVVTDVPTPAVPVPGLGTVLVPIEGDAAASGVADDLADDLAVLVESVGWGVSREGNVFVATASGPVAALSAVGVAPAWAVGERGGTRLLVVSWSAESVREALAALARR